jgi:3-methylfumaryl-CoA hydratase
MTDDIMTWVGRSETSEVRLDPWPANALQASLDLARPEQAITEDLPPLWHWLYFLEAAPRSRIGSDGHPQRGGFMPPIDLPRRMFAGGRSRFERPLKLGQLAHQTREILKIERKTSGSGDLVFVTVGHDYEQDGVLCIREERDFVFLAPQPPSSAALAAIEPPPAGQWRISLTPDPVLLFRFSALTFNGHRIHYDTAYAQVEENLAERVVHGPLTAILLAELVRLEAGKAVRRFEFRARKPFFVGQAMTVNGTLAADGDIELHAQSAGGGLMTARAEAV